MYPIQFSSVVGGDIGGRGSARLQVFYEKNTKDKDVFKPTQTKFKTDSVEFKFDDKNLEDTLILWSEEIAKLVEPRQKHFETDPIRAIGMAFPGTIKDKSKIVLADNLTKNTQAKWENIDLQEFWPPVLKKVFDKAGLSNCLSDKITVTLANDLVAGALGERVYGAGKSFNPDGNGVINLVQVGTGYGGSTMVVTPKTDILLPGEPGQTVLDAEIGKTVEHFIGHHALRDYANQLGLGEDLKPKAVFAQAYDESLPEDVREKAKSVVDTVIEKLAQSVAFDVQRYNTPKRIITGGGIPRGIEKMAGKGGFLKRFSQAVKKRTRLDEFKQTQFKMSAFENNLIGAAILADTDRYEKISPNNRTLIY